MRLSNRSKATQWLALLAVLALVFAACGGSKKDDKGASNTTATTAVAVPQGGTLVIGAEQEPDCVDWIGSCSGSSWGFWTMHVNTIPHAYVVVPDGDSWKYAPTDLLAGEATLVTSPKQVVTFKLNPKAVWSDKTPITSADFKYTWDQIKNGKDIYDRSGMRDVESVDATDPQTAVVTFSTKFADWKQLFGGQFGILPAHLLEGKDRNKEMANGYTWSGGPFKIEAWQKGVQWTLIPNENYWGPKPKLDKVIFKLVADTSAEFQAFKAGEVAGIYPQPQLDAVDQINAGLPDAKAQYTGQTGNAEGLWMHNGKEPFDDKNFRQAIGYSLDRDAVVKRLFGGVKVDKALGTVTAPILSKFATLDAFKDYKKDLSKVDSLMKASGWAKGADGIWAKGAKKASFEIKSTTGNKRRELTEQIIQQQLKEAGFDLRINNQKAGDLFGDILPKGDYQMALFANVLTSFYPSNCTLFCSKNVPTAANKFSGNNWYRVNNPELDKLLGDVDSNLDEAAAQAANKKADKLIADNALLLPLDPLPNILLTSKKIVGPVSDNPIMGPFFRISEWGLTP